MTLCLLWLQSRTSCLTSSDSPAHMISLQTDKCHSSRNTGLSGTWRSVNVLEILRSSARVNVSNRRQSELNLGWEMRGRGKSLRCSHLASTQAATRRLHEVAAARCTTHWNCVKAQTLLNLLFTHYLTNAAWKCVSQPCFFSHTKPPERRKTSFMCCH